MRIMMSVLAATLVAGAFAQTFDSSAIDNTPLRAWYIDYATGQGWEIPLGDVQNGGVSGQSGPITSYSNITTYTGFVATGGRRADDLHMTQGGLVNGFTFVYSDATGGAALTDAPVGFWEGADPDPGAGPTVLLRSLLITGLPGDGHWLITVNLEGSGFEFTAPKDIFAELDLSDASRSHARHSIWNPPTIGSSHDLFWRWDGGSGPGYYYFGGSPVANFGWEIKMTPEPGTIAAMAVGLLGLVGLRRRK